LQPAKSIENFRQSLQIWRNAAAVISEVEAAKKFLEKS
jgi:hypothetical protein